MSPQVDYHSEIFYMGFHEQITLNFICYLEVFKYSWFFPKKNIYVHELKTYLLGMEAGLLTASVVQTKAVLLHLVLCVGDFSVPVLLWGDKQGAHTLLHGCRPQTGSINNAESALCFISLPPTVYASGELKHCAAPPGSSSKPQDNHHTGAHHRAKLRPIRTKPPSGSQSNNQNTNGNFKLLLEIISVSHQPSSAAGWKSSRVRPFGGFQTLV